MPIAGLRAGETGPILVGAVLSVTPASIIAPNQNTATVTDARFAGCTAVIATFGATTAGANLLLCGALVTTVATGALAVRCAAVGANYASAAESIFFQRLN